MKLNENTLKELETSAIKQITLAKTIHDSATSFIVELNSLNKLHIGTVDEYTRNVYDSYGDVLDSSFNGNPNCQYFNLYGGSIDELTNEIKQLFGCLPTVLELRERSERISQKIANFLAGKDSSYNLYILLTNRKACWGITSDELNTEELQAMFKEKYGEETRGYCACEEISNFYEEPSEEEEENWYEFEQEPSEKKLYYFVLDLLEKNLKYEIFMDNITGEDMSKYKKLVGMEKFLTFDDEI